MALRMRVEEGEGFDPLAREYSTDPSGAAGGYIGSVDGSDLREEFREALSGLTPGGVSAPVSIGTDYFLLSIPTEAERRWIEESSAGLEALTAGREGEADAHLRAALDLAGDFSPGDARLHESLRRMADFRLSMGDYTEALGLFARLLPELEDTLGADDPEVARVLTAMGDAWRLQEEPGRADPLYRRAIAILESDPDPEGLELAVALNGLAFSRSALEDPPEAARLLHRTLDILEGSLGPGHPAVIGVLHNLSRVLGDQGAWEEAEDAARRALSLGESLAGPRDPSLAEGLANLAGLLESQGEYAGAVARYRRALGILSGLQSDPEGPLTADVFDLFTLQFGIAPFSPGPDAETLEPLTEAMEDAGAGPDLYAALAEILLEYRLNRQAQGLLGAAIERFPQSPALRLGLGEAHAAAGRIRLALDVFEEGVRIAGSDAVWGSLLSRRIGDLEVLRTDLAAAERAYRRALGMDPDDAESHTGLGLIHFLGGSPDQGRAEFTVATRVDPGNFLAWYRLAQANLSLGLLEEADSAAARALTLEPDDTRARSIRVRALVRLGQDEMARQEAERYQNRDDQERILQDAEFAALSIEKEIARTLAAGDDARAADLYAQAVAEYPGVADLRFELGLTEARLGRHQEAVGTWLEMVDSGLDTFPVHLRLSEEYALLGDPEASREHEAIYLRKLLADLGERL